MESRKQSNPVSAAGSPDRTVLLERAPLDLPLNLAGWVAPEKIAHWILEEVAQVDFGKSEGQGGPGHLPESRSRVVLGVLLLAYSTHRFSSSEIVSACHSDKVLNGICEGKMPFIDELEHFRRRHRVLLENLLGQLLVRAVKEQFLPVGHLPAGLQHSLMKRAVEQIDTARHMSTLDTE